MGQGVDFGGQHRGPRIQPLEVCRQRAAVTKGIKGSFGAGGGHQASLSPCSSLLPSLAATTPFPSLRSGTWGVVEATAGLSSGSGSSEIGGGDGGRPLQGRRRRRLR